MSNTPPRDHLDLIDDLIESKAAKAQSEEDRFLAELSLPPIKAAASAGTQPGSDTDGQRSQWSSFSYDRPGSEKPAETRTPLDS